MNALHQTDESHNNTLHNDTQRQLTPASLGTPQTYIASADRPVFVEPVPLSPLAHLGVEATPPNQEEESEYEGSFSNWENSFSITATNHTLINTPIVYARNRLNFSTL
jgi:hypothetical protein